MPLLVYIQHFMVIIIYRTMKVCGGGEIIDSGLNIIDLSYVQW